MKEYDDYSAKEKKQLAVCQRLITEKSYLSQGGNPPRFAKPWL